MTKRTLSAHLKRTSFYSLAKRTAFALLFLGVTCVWGQWTEPVPMEPQFGEAVVAPWISNDGLRLYFAATGVLFVTERDSIGAPWGPLQEPAAHINSGTRQESPCESPSGDTLYFMSWSREDAPSYGLYDIYYCVRADSGWGLVQNCGPNINSADIEWSVGISRDGQMLLVSSDRLPTTGGRDIYYSERQTDGTWGSLISFGPLANGIRDDEHPTISPDNSTLYTYVVGPSRGNIWVSRRTGGVWQQATALPPPVNSITNQERDPCIATDGRTLWFARHDDDIEGFRIYTSVDTTNQAVGGDPRNANERESLVITSWLPGRLEFTIPRQPHSTAAEITIHNVLGQLVADGSTSLIDHGKTSQGGISLKSLASGTYLVRVSNGELSWSTLFTYHK